MWKLKLWKENHQRLLLSLELALVSLVISLLINVNICCALDNVNFTVNTKEPIICFTEVDAKQMIVLLENSEDYKEQIILLKQGNSELEKQVILLKEVNKLQQEQLGISKTTIESYKTLLEVQKEAYEKQIENIKPSFLSKILPTIGGIGIGVLVGILL